MRIDEYLYSGRTPYLDPEPYYPYPTPDPYYPYPTPDPSPYPTYW